MALDPVTVSDRSRLLVNHGQVAAKTFDDEVILINLATGVYYTIETIGSSIWKLIAKQYSMAEIATALSDGYEVSVEQARRDIGELAAQLIAEELVTVTEDAVSLEPVVRQTVSEKRAYLVPRLDVYRDMELLLALDPPLPRYKETPWKDR